MDNNLYNRVLKINKDFGFKPLNTSSLNFACDMYRDKNDFKKCAALIRAIAVHHAFTDRNKSTTQVAVEGILRKNYNINQTGLKYLLLEIVTQNINDIELIERRLRRCCQRKK